MSDRGTSRGKHGFPRAPPTPIGSPRVGTGAGGLLRPAPGGPALREREYFGLAGCQGQAKGEGLDGMVVPLKSTKQPDLTGNGAGELDTGPIGLVSDPCHGQPIE